MRTDLDRKRTGIVLSPVLISWLPAWSIQAADQPPGAGVQPSLQPTVPVGEGASARATWVDDIANALDSYFNTNYPADDFAPYLRKLTLVGDALGRGDRRTVKVEMGAFFRWLANRSHGISARAAEELANFARMVMAVREHGIVFPRSEPEEYGKTFPRTEVRTERGEHHGVGNEQEISYVD